jgi:4-hydroxy-3-methylbut-2-en-1-yl diphosphate synthase IspG/GcpE
VAIQVGVGITGAGTLAMDGVAIQVGVGITGAGTLVLAGVETSVLVGTIGMEIIGDMRLITTKEIIVTIQVEEDLVMLIPQTQTEEHLVIIEVAIL